VCQKNSEGNATGLNIEGTLVVLTVVLWRGGKKAENKQKQILRLRRRMTTKRRRQRQRNRNRNGNGERERQKRTAGCSTARRTIVCAASVESGRFS
jgi:hypothetical protein